jgi:hypothetical protein
MKRLSLLALSALFVAGTATAAQAQVVITEPGASITVATPAPLAGAVIVEDTGSRRLPSGYNETGRLGRYMGSERLQYLDIQYRNRDFQHWYPMEATTKAKVDRVLDGSPRSQNHPIADYETGRLARFMARNDHALRNNVMLRNRDFYPHYEIYAPTAKSMIDRRVRGLATDTSRVSNRRIVIRTPDAQSPGVVHWF